MKIITTKAHTATWGSSEFGGFYHIKCLDIDISEAEKFKPVYSAVNTEYYFNPELISAENLETIQTDGYIFFTSTGVFQCLRELP
jgi:hypothetical protein